MVSFVHFIPSDITQIIVKNMIIEQPYYYVPILKLVCKDFYTIVKICIQKPEVFFPFLSTRQIFYEIILNALCESTMNFQLSLIRVNLSQTEACTIHVQHEYSLNGGDESKSISKNRISLPHINGKHDGFVANHLDRTVVEYPLKSNVVPMKEFSATSNILHDGPIASLPVWRTKAFLNDILKREYPRADDVIIGINSHWPTLSTLKKLDMKIECDHVHHRGVEDLCDFIRKTNDAKAEKILELIIVMMTQPRLGGVKVYGYRMYIYCKVTELDPIIPFHHLLDPSKHSLLLKQCFEKYCLQDKKMVKYRECNVNTCVLI